MIPLKTANDVDLKTPVSSFLRNTFPDLGKDVISQMATDFNTQRKNALIRGTHSVAGYLCENFI